MLLHLPCLGWWNWGMLPHVVGTLGLHIVRSHRNCRTSYHSVTVPPAINNHPPSRLSQHPIMLLQLAGCALSRWRV